LLLKKASAGRLRPGREFIASGYILLPGQAAELGKKCVDITLRGGKLPMSRASDSLKITDKVVILHDNCRFANTMQEIFSKMSQKNSTGMIAGRQKTR